MGGEEKKRKGFASCELKSHRVVARRPGTLCTGWGNKCLGLMKENDRFAASKIVRPFLSTKAPLTLWILSSLWCHGPIYYGKVVLTRSIGPVASS